MMEFLIRSTCWMALFYLGYLVLKREKQFTFLRFFLIGGVVFSMIVPFISIPYAISGFEADLSHQMIGTFTSNNPIAKMTNNKMVNEVDTFHQVIIIWSLYLIGCLVMFFRFFRNLLSILRLKSEAKMVTQSNIKIAIIDQTCVPFSFGKVLYINKDDFNRHDQIESLILHESVHIDRWHTVDRMILEIMLLIYWFNPLLWLFNRAIRYNHEFESDHQVIKKIDYKKYAHALIKETAIHTTPFFGSPFNYSLTKKRLLMLNQKKTNYLRFGIKLGMFSSLAFILFSAFAFRIASSPIKSSDQSFTVVIDAAHGGSDYGTVNPALQLREKEVVLNIVREMKMIAFNPSIQVLYTRESDQTISLSERIDLVNESQPDLVISLHTNDHSNPQKRGMEIYYSEQNSEKIRSLNDSKIFYQHFQGSSIHPTGLYQADFLILKSVMSPSVVLELGFLSNEKDGSLLSSITYRQTIAQLISASIEDIYKNELKK